MLGKYRTYHCHGSASVCSTPLASHVQPSCRLNLFLFIWYGSSVCFAFSSLPEADHLVGTVSLQSLKRRINRILSNKKIKRCRLPTLELIVLETIRQKLRTREQTCSGRAPKQKLSCHSGVIFQRAAAMPFFA